MRFVQADGATLPFGQCFDVVMSFDVLEHIPDSDRHLQEVRRVLRPGGHYVLQTPNKLTNAVFETIRWRSLRHGAPTTARFGQLQRRLRAAGFSVRPGRSACQPVLPQQGQRPSGEARRCEPSPSSTPIVSRSASGPTSTLSRRSLPDAGPVDGRGRQASDWRTSGSRYEGRALSPLPGARGGAGRATRRCLCRGAGRLIADAFFGYLVEAYDVSVTSASIGPPQRSALGTR